MSIKEELLALWNEQLGKVVPEEALDWARTHPQSELHKAIRWDTDWNVQQYLLFQMRHLIVLHIRSENHVPQVVSLSIDRVLPGGGYRKIADVLPVPELRNIMLQDALAELMRVRRKYETLVELANVWLEIDKAAQKGKLKKQEPKQTEQA